MSNFILDMFEKAGAIRRGHFVLSSGRLTDTYMDKAKVFSNAKNVEKLALLMKHRLWEFMGRPAHNNGAGTAYGLTHVVSPAIGAIPLGYEVGRMLGLPMVYTEKSAEGIQYLGRFDLPKGSKILIVEDVVTTGGAVREVIRAIKGSMTGDQGGSAGVEIACALAVIDRGPNVYQEGKEWREIDGIPFIPLVRMPIETWPRDKIPARMKDIPITNP